MTCGFSRLDCRRRPVRRIRRAAVLGEFGRVGLDEMRLAAVADLIVASEDVVGRDLVDDLGGRDPLHQNIQSGRRGHAVGRGEGDAAASPPRAQAAGRRTGLHDRMPCRQRRRMNSHRNQRRRHRLMDGKVLSPHVTAHAPDGVQKKESRDWKSPTTAVHQSGAPGGTRTHTVQILRLSPLPIGIQGLSHNLTRITRKIDFAKAAACSAFRAMGSIVNEIWSHNIC